jgi:hypothetical protein
LQIGAATDSSITRVIFCKEREFQNTTYTAIDEAAATYLDNTVKAQTGK